MKGTRLGILFAISALAGGAALARAQEFGQRRGPALDPALLSADRQIMGEIRHNSQLMDNLEYLSDMIGPRLTGSEKLKRANDWTLQKFREYGLSAHLEKWTMPLGWARGSATASVVEPNTLPLAIASAAWCPGTSGTVRGPVVYVDADSAEAFAKYRGKLHNAIVLTSPPADVPPPSTPQQAGTPTPLPQENAANEGGGSRRVPSAQGVPFAPFRRQLAQLLKEEGAACTFRDSGKEHALLNMTSGGAGEAFSQAPLPGAFITHEGYTLLWRLMKRGTVQVEVNISNTFTPGPIDVYNTVADLPGSEKSDEVVIIGGHLDSWDLGTGATDNGTGAMAVLEAARALSALHLKPKRTIRFILFTGEEEGLVGSREYVKTHQSEMAQVDAVLVHDTGTGKVTGIGLQGRFEDGPALEMATEPLRSVGFEGLRPVRMGGTDHLSFDRAGVPAFACAQDRAEYGKTHHSQSDTFDKVWKDDITQGAMVLAVWAYNVANLPEMLPRRGTSSVER